MSDLPPEIQRAILRCRLLGAVSLEEFLDSLLDEDPDVLARMPGTPGEVLAAQFTYYARQSVSLRESQRRSTDATERIVQRLIRLEPDSRKEKGGGSS